MEYPCHPYVKSLPTDTTKNICDRIWENPPYGIRARFAQCAFLVAQVQICQSPDFVIYMSNNPSNCCRLLRRLVMLYEGEISVHFDPPSRHSRRTQSPLLWAVIRILYLDTARFIDLLYVRSPFWASKNNRLSLSTTKFNSCSIFTFISNGSAQVHLIDFRVTRSMRKRHTRA